MKKFLCGMMIFLFSPTLISACGPSEEAIATITASVWTPTPEPTLTPTPLPFDLEVTLEGEGGENVFYGAYVAATEHEEVMADETGNAVLMNLPGPEVDVSVIAQGYNPHTETVTLERGKNAIMFTLTADPLQVNPASACLEGQEVLFIEDFEDKTMQGWEGIARPIWDYVEFEDRGTAVVIDSIEGDVHAEGPVSYGNGVWHFDILRGPEMGLLWLRIHSAPDQSYIILFDGNIGFGLQYEPGGYGLVDRNLPPGDGETWERFSVAYYDGVIDIYRDGELWLGTTVEDPLYPDGSISITTKYKKTHLDNLVVCGLEEPYVPPVSEENVD